MVKNFLFVFLFSIFSAAFLKADVLPCPPKPPLLEFFPSLQWRAGDGRSYRDGYETVGLFISSPKGCSPFIDLELHRVEKGKFAANVGLGFRFPLNDCQHVMGGNIYYDTRHFREGNLHQLGLGVELLGKWWDVVVNGYIPLGGMLFHDQTVFTYVGDYFAERNLYRSGMWGLDVEVGRYFYRNRCFQIYGAIGPYFYGSRCCNNLIGGMGRICAGFRKYFSLEFLSTYDSLFRAKFQGEIRIKIPLCKLFCSSPYCCVHKPIQRNRIIIWEKICCWKTNF